MSKHLVPDPPIDDPDGPRLPPAAVTTRFEDALGVRGRGAGWNPGNRFETVRLHVHGEALDREMAEREEDRAGDRADESGGGPCHSAQVATTVHRDSTRRIINAVDPRVSPDLGFRWTINPYRGCEHGCVYCYARPSHEFLGFSLGLDFETQIVAKHDAARLLKRELADPRWNAETIVLSGVTDPWQPIERRLRITRSILEVLSACGHPVSVITKSRLIVRDLDLIGPLASVGACRAAISITTLDDGLARILEPRASRPADRLRAIRELTDAGVPVAVMVAPVIPGLNDREIPRVLAAAREAGASAAGWVMLRLPFQLKDLFLAFLRERLPDRAARIESLLREVRGGGLYDPRHGVRGRGEGPMAEQVAAMFRLFAKKYGLDRALPPLTTTRFARPTVDGQMALFG
ncbi:MAG: PA0069 family radical SAM protein [Phycisphaerales bacterium]|nr:PA0069 family radical SAM protein [Phycisphaerales bacterium]